MLMNKILNEVMDNIQTFNPQSYENMTVIGLNIPENKKVDLMSLEIGLNLGLVEISEIDEGGTVGKVKVINNAVTPLLILDGEEIIGSKQNRVVNATIIIDAKSEKIIPVSCTEAGRWKYNTDKFQYSQHMAASRVRRNKLGSVSKSLRNIGSIKSNQSRVWADIADIEDDLHIESKTSALNDSYRQRELDIEEYKNAFSLQENQNGLLVYINGQVVGLEMVYNTSRYKEYHDKLVESYIIDAISKSDEKYDQSKESEADFLDDIRKASCESFDSVGLGVDYRIENEDITGSAMVFEDTVINASIFKKIEI